jgi:hypothetical protein
MGGAIAVSDCGGRYAASLAPWNITASAVSPAYIDRHFCWHRAAARREPPSNFLEAGKKRLAGDTARAATSDEVKDLRREASPLKEVVAELTLENRLLKKSMIADGRSNRGKRLRREGEA